VTTLRQHPMVRGHTELLIYGKACSKMSTSADTRACSCGPKIPPWIGLGAYSYCSRVAFSLCCWESCGRNWNLKILWRHSLSPFPFCPQGSCRRLNLNCGMRSKSIVRTKSCSGVGSGSLIPLLQRMNRRLIRKKLR